MTGRPPPPPPRPPFCNETTQVINRPSRGHEETDDLMPHTAPVIASATKIKVELGTLIKWGSAVVAATVWAWSLWSDVQRLKDDTREMRQEAKQMAADVATIKRVVMPQAYASTANQPPRFVVPPQADPGNE